MGIVSDSADHIEKITAGYSQIDPEHVKEQFNEGTFPDISKEEVEDLVKKAKVPNGLSFTDPDRRILLNHREIFVEPLLLIFRNVLKTCIWPKSWKLESVTPIPKKDLMETMGDVRPISLTPWYSKVLESYVRPLILQDVYDSEQKRQFGGIKGCDVNQPMAIILHETKLLVEDRNIFVIHLFFDYSKAFNSMDYGHLIESAARLGVRNEVIRLASSYMTGRKTMVRWGQGYSSLVPIRGGVGQGTLLSVVFFRIAVDLLLKRLNDAFVAIPENLRPSAVMYVDDLHFQVPVDRRTLDRKPNGDYVFKDTNNNISRYLGIVEDFSKMSMMRLNKKKTVGILNYFGQNKVDFEINPIHFPNGEEIKMEESTKYLGFDFNKNLDPTEFVKSRKAGAMGACWDVLRLSKVGANTSTLKKVWKSYGRARLEWGCGVQHSELEQKHRDSLESPQRVVSRYILGTPRHILNEGYIPYSQRIERLELQPIRDRCQNLANRFYEKCGTSERLTQFFQQREIDHLMAVRQRPLYTVPQVRSVRLSKSPIIAAINYCNQARLRGDATVEENSESEDEVWESTVEEHHTSNHSSSSESEFSFTY